MIWLLWLSTVSAAPPDKMPVAFTVGSGVVSDLTVSDDGALIGATSGGSATLLDVNTWTVESVLPCSVEAVTFVTLEDSSLEFWVGCADGSLWPYSWATGEFSNREDGDGNSVSVDLGDASVEALFFDQDYVHAVISPDDGAEVRVIRVDPQEGTVAGEVATFFKGFSDAALTTNQIHIAHGKDDFSTYGTAGALSSYVTGTYLVDVDDITPSMTFGVYAADLDNDAVWEYLSTATLVGEILPVLTDLDGLEAVGTSSRSEDAWLLVALSGQVDVYDLSSGGLNTSELLGSFGSVYSLSDIIVSPSKYSFGGTSSGELVLITSHPWVSEVSTSIEYDVVEETDTDTADTAEPSTTLASSGVLTVQFETDESGTYEIALGGTWEGGGTSLGSGDASAGEMSVDIEVDTADSAWSEGTNSIFVFVTSSGLVGHGASSLELDTAPAQVELSSENLGYEDEELLLQFEGIPDDDLARYDVYVTTEMFAAEDWPSGGPEFVGDDPIVSPITETAVSPGANVSIRIGPLTNDVTYYVAVRAVDSGGLEGPMSNVVSEYPRASFNAVQTSGDPGGCACQASGNAPSQWWIGGLMFLGILGARRSKHWTVLAGIAITAGLLHGAVAEAADRQSRKDLTPAWGQFEIRYGPVWLEDDRITSVYSNSYSDERKRNVFGEALQLEIGPQFFRYLELDLGFGFLQELDFTKDEDGEDSARRTMFTWFPLSTSVTGRAHFWDEQFLVPYASYGRDWIFWSEKSDDGQEGKDVTNGMKFGWHWAVGGSILLDVFQRSRASLLEAHSGINDTYLTFEYRAQRIAKGSDVEEGEDQLSFSGRLFTVGLKLDF